MLGSHDEEHAAGERTQCPDQGLVRPNPRVFVCQSCASAGGVVRLLSARSRLSKMHILNEAWHQGSAHLGGSWQVTQDMSA